MRPGCLSSRSLFLCSLLSLVSLLCLSALTMAGGMPGGARVIEGAANDAQVSETAAFAVQQHNKKENSELKLLRVVSATKQVVAGTVVKVRFLAANPLSSTVAEYEASVWEKPWEHFKELSEFKELEGTSRHVSAAELKHVEEGKPAEHDAGSA